MKPLLKKPNFKYIVIFTATFLALTLISVLPQGQSVFSGLGQIFSPVQRFLYRTKLATGQFWYYLTQETESEVEKLKNENERLQAELGQMSLIAKENETLRTELNVQRTHKRNVALAHIIGEKPGSFSRFLILDIGSNQGLRPGLPVIINNALVGKIEKVSDHSSEMSLVTDPNSVYYSYLQKTKTKGLIQGTIGLGILHLTQIPKNAVIEKGEMVFTTGQELENFNDILIGQVTEILSSDQETYLTLLVTPAVDSANLDTVFIVLD